MTGQNPKNIRNTLIHENEGKIDLGWRAPEEKMKEYIKNHFPEEFEQSNKTALDFLINKGFYFAYGFFSDTGKGFLLQAPFQTHEELAKWIVENNPRLTRSFERVGMRSYADFLLMQDYIKVGNVLDEAQLRKLKGVKLDKLLRMERAVYIVSSNKVNKVFGILNKYHDFGYEVEIQDENLLKG